MRIVFACGSGGPNYTWADPDAERGIGGSEECLILLARELAALGHQVFVYNNCGDKKGLYHGVIYVNHNFYERMPPCDLLVAWRNWYLLIGKQATQKWLWCHDQPVGCHCPCQEEIDRDDSAFNHIDKFVLLNNHHRGLYHHIPDDKVFICPIGVDHTPYYDLAELVTPVEREWSRVLYFSHPHRGLDRLRALWPQIKAAVSEATLAAFWWEPEHFRPPDEGLGILPMSHLGFREIAKETLRAGIFGYPSVFAPEISPATTIKAQMGGAYPVVIVQGGMVDTVKFGRKCQNDQEFVTAMITALGHSKLGNLEPERQAMRGWAFSEFCWTRVAGLWVDQYERSI